MHLLWPWKNLPSPPEETNRRWWTSSFRTTSEASVPDCSLLFYNILRQSGKDLVLFSFKQMATFPFLIGSKPRGTFLSCETISLTSITTCNALILVVLTTKLQKANVPSVRLLFCAVPFCIAWQILSFCIFSLCFARKWMGKHRSQLETERDTLSTWLPIFLLMLLSHLFCLPAALVVFFFPFFFFSL